MHRSAMMTIATQQDPAGPVTLALTGKCSGGGLGELRRAIDRARRMGKQIIIDLSEVTLMDRPSWTFSPHRCRRTSSWSIVPSTSSRGFVTQVYHEELWRKL